MLSTWPGPTTTPEAGRGRRSGHCPRHVTVVVTLFHPRPPRGVCERAPAQGDVTAVGVVEGADDVKSQNVAQRAVGAPAALSAADPGRLDPRCRATSSHTL